MFSVLFKLWNQIDSDSDSDSDSRSPRQTHKGFFQQKPRLIPAHFVDFWGSTMPHGRVRRRYLWIIPTLLLADCHNILAFNVFQLNLASRMSFSPLLQGASRRPSPRTAVQCSKSSNRVVSLASPLSTEVLKQQVKYFWVLSKACIQVVQRINLPLLFVCDIIICSHGTMSSVRTSTSISCEQHLAAMRTSKRRYWKFFLWLINLSLPCQSWLPPLSGAFAAIAIFLDIVAWLMQ